MSYPASRERIIYYVLPIYSFLKNSQKTIMERADKKINLFSIYSYWFENPIPQFLRRFMWCISLNISLDYRDVYSSFDFKCEQPHPIDSQLDVDIPRCHSYHYLLSSFPAQISLRRIIKAWIFHNPSQCYWQGLDSIAATLLSMVQDESLAFELLNQVCKKFLNDMYVEDNNNCLNIMLTIYSQVLIL